MPHDLARTLVVGEQVVGAAQADEAHDRHQAGAHPQPRNGQAFEQPQNEGAYHQAAEKYSATRKGFKQPNSSDHKRMMSAIPTAPSTAAGAPKKGASSGK